MTRLALWTAVGVMIGLLVHLATVLAIPRLATRSAFQRLEMLGPPDVFQRVPAALPGPTLLPAPDPAIHMAVCRYDLTAAPLHVVARVAGSFFSVSFYTAEGLNYYALNDRAAPDGRLELTVYTSLQLADVRSREGPDTPEALRIEAPRKRGLVVLRALAPDASAVPAIDAALDGARCASAPVISGGPSRPFPTGSRASPPSSG